jgi:hypothetical protein
MVVASLSIGAVVGVLLSGGFVWWEVGRYAVPQVPVTLFDERKELFAYTAGLFVGVPIAIVAILFFLSLANGALPGALLFLAALIAATEIAQWALLRTRFWGRSESGPFYALGYRAAIGGIVALAIVAQYLGGSSLTVPGIALVLVDALAIVGLEVAGALLSIRGGLSGEPRRGGPVSGAIFGAIGFFLVGLGPLGGEVAAFGGALVALFGAGLVYRRLRPMLSTIPAPGGGGPPSGPLPPSEYRRKGGPLPSSEAPTTDREAR